MTQLARKLRVTDYFTLGWGTMVGVGWLVVMDDWLLRGGPLGGILGFAIGGSLLLPIGYVYGKLVAAMPDAAGEVAYTAKVFPRSISYATGWMMMLAYFIVCPWEAVAMNRYNQTSRRPIRRSPFGNSAIVASDPRTSANMSECESPRWPRGAP